MWHDFGFIEESAASGGGTGSVSLKTSVNCTSSNLVDWTIASSDAFIPGTLSISINGLTATKNIDFEEGLDGLSWSWISEDEDIYLGDDVRAMFMFNT